MVCERARVRILGLAAKRLRKSYKDFTRSYRGREICRRAKPGTRYLSPVSVRVGLFLPFVSIDGQLGLTVHPHEWRYQTNATRARNPSQNQSAWCIYDSVREEFATNVLFVPNLVISLRLTHVVVCLMRVVVCRMRVVVYLMRVVVCRCVWSYVSCVWSCI